MLLKTTPAVFSVGNTYQIMVQTERNSNILPQIHIVNKRY